MMEAHLRYPCLKMPHRTPRNQTSASPSTRPRTQPRRMTTIPRPPTTPRGTNTIPRLLPPPYRDSLSPTPGPSGSSTQCQFGSGLPPTAQPPTTVHTTLQRAPRHCHPAWTYLKPEVYDSDGERRRIKYSPSTSSPTNSNPPSPPRPHGTSQSPPAMSSIATSAYQTAPSGLVSPPSLPSPPRSDPGSQGQDEGTHYLGEGTQ